MSTKYKGGDKVWLKAVVADPGRHVLHDSEFVVVPQQRTANPYWLRVSHTRMRPRVKRKRDSSTYDEDTLLRAVQRVLVAIATAAGMRAAREEGVGHGRWVALSQVRDDLGTVRYVASRVVHEVIDALQWDVTETMRKSTATVPEMHAVKGLQYAMRKLDRDWMCDMFDANLSLADVLEAKP